MVDNTLRDKCNPPEILQSIVERLREVTGWATVQNCYVADQPVPDKAFTGGLVGCTVCMGDASFLEEYWSGSATLMASRKIVVTPFVSMYLDRGSRAEAKVLSSDPNKPSISFLENSVLVALLAKGWEPVDGNRPLLRDGSLMPKRIIGPAEMMIGEKPYMGSQIEFMATFDWNLTQ